jgi:hypothetical protein
MPDRECFVCKVSKPESDFPNAIYPVEFGKVEFVAGQLQLRDIVKFRTVANLDL